MREAPTRKSPIFNTYLQSNTFQIVFFKVHFRLLVKAPVDSISNCRCFNNFQWNFYSFRWMLELKQSLDFHQKQLNIARQWLLSILRKNSLHMISSWYECIYFAMAESSEWSIRRPHTSRCFICTINLSVLI